MSVVLALRRAETIQSSSRNIECGNCNRQKCPIWIRNMKKVGSCFVLNSESESKAQRAGHSGLGISATGRTRANSPSMWIMNATVKLRFTNINDDHQVLVDLIASAGSICRLPALKDCQSDRCPKGDAMVCLSSLIELGDKVRNYLLDHLRREDALMNSMPATRDIVTHCRSHRHEHTKFTTAYNNMASKFDSRIPGSSARYLEEFILEWSRDHALKYDAELATLLDAQALHASLTRRNPVPTGSKAAFQLASAQSTRQRTTRMIFANSARVA